MTKRSFLAWLAGIPIVGRLIPQQGATEVTLTAPALGNRMSALDHFFTEEAIRIECRIQERLYEQHGTMENWGKGLATSAVVVGDWICLVNLLLLPDAGHHVTATIENLITVAVSQIVTLRKSFRTAVKVEWNNVRNNDITSEEYNPYAERGRFIITCAIQNPTIHCMKIGEQMTPQNT
jgi:hypothetical protein